jgi:hypothetical protein
LPARCVRASTIVIAIVTAIVILIVIALALAIAIAIAVKKWEARKLARDSLPGGKYLIVATMAVFAAPLSESSSRKVSLLHD